MALFSECMLSCARKLLDTADIVREAILLQIIEGPCWADEESSQGWRGESRHRYPVSCRVKKRCEPSIFLISSSLGR